MLIDNSHSVVRMNIDDIGEVFGGGAAASVAVGQKRSCKIVDGVYNASVVASLPHVLDGLESPVSTQNRSLLWLVANPIAPN